VEPVRSYLMCSMPRSGGGLLGGLLRSSGIAGYPEEYFWRGDMPQWRGRWSVATDKEYLSAALREGTTPNGVFGGRVMWTYLEDVIEFVAAATGSHIPPQAKLAFAFPDLQYVHMTRRDHVAQAVSWAKAVQTGVWFSWDTRRRPGTPSYDGDLIERLLAAVEESERCWSSFFSQAGVAIHAVTYEDLAADPVGETESVLAFLGVASADVRVEVQTEPQSDATNAAWIARYRAEHSRAVGT
jgi:LPS sulfotransferase NodH